MFPQQSHPVLGVGPPGPVSPAGGNGDELPACLSCRKRKLRCSRELPSCSQCLRLATECVYDQKRQKPGLKPGAIENLNQRLQQLEQRLDNLSRERAPSEVGAVGSADVREYAATLLSDLAKHLGGSRSRHGDEPNLIPLDSGEPSPPAKRRRLDLSDGAIPDDAGLPSQDVLDAVITKYFQTVHHWIPMLHEGRFRRRLKDANDLAEPTILLHAMVATTLKHVDRASLSLDHQTILSHVRSSTAFVTRQATDRLSIESCQALVMLCFERMGSGEWKKAFPLVGLLVRAVDVLQLTVEPDERRPRPLLPPVPLLRPATSNAEVEERKRVFWAAFMLDRLVSVTCGFSTAFTSDNVSRQLPCNGGIWRRDEASRTPYFGIWEKSQARIGNSISLLPTHKASPNEPASFTRSPSAGSAVDISQLGALAYRIEATESLSQVTSFFLQQNIDFEDRNHVSDWLTRFKELDLRLVQWKKFLPDRWKESNVSKDAILRMDPNLTLAHCLHNSALILLHQPIAYPPPRLKAICKLPNHCSAETCEQGAVETSAIASKYLRFAEDIMVNTEFVYCLMVAAKVLLVHSYYYNTSLSSEFFTLVQNLKEMSRRWRSLSREQNLDEPEALDLAGIYAHRLQEYHERCRREPEFADQILAFSGGDVLGQYEHVPALDLEQIAGAAGTPITPGRQQSMVARSEREDRVTPMHFPRSDSDTVPSIAPSPIAQMARPPSAPMQHAPVPPQMNVNSFRPAYQRSPDNLMMMSDLLNGQGFTEMDRVIYSNGADFGFYGPEFGYNYTQA